MERRVWWKCDNVVSNLLTWNCIYDGNEVEDDSDVSLCLWLAMTISLSTGRVVRFVVLAIVFAVRRLYLGILWFF
jgi:hypothetical protein